MDLKDSVLDFSHIGPPAVEESYGSKIFCANDGGVPLHLAVDDKEVESARFFTVEELVDQMFPEDLSESEDLNDSDMYESLPLKTFYPPTNPSGTD